jgi:hypothetical protein
VGLQIGKAPVRRGGGGGPAANAHEFLKRGIHFFPAPRFVIVDHDSIAAAERRPIGAFQAAGRLLGHSVH